MIDSNIKAIQETFSYDPISGTLYWRKDRPESHWKQRGYYLKYMEKQAGKPAVSTRQGYPMFRVNNTMQYAHRIVFVLMEGKYPEGDIDHINGDVTDYRWLNLRDTSHQLNNRNMIQNCKNSSGYTGVSLFKRTGKWRAYVNLDEGQKHLGYHPTASVANQVRQDFIKSNPTLGYTDRHGT